VDGAKKPLRVDGVEYIKGGEGGADFVGLQVADEVSGEQGRTASCTRFSPMSVTPASSADRTAPGPNVLEMATRETPDGSRPAR
jgi:hypothetical protein